MARLYMKVDGSSTIHNQIAPGNIGIVSKPARSLLHSLQLEINTSISFGLETMRWKSIYTTSNTSPHSPSPREGQRHRGKTPSNNLWFTYEKKLCSSGPGNLQCQYSTDGNRDITYKKFSKLIIPVILCLKSSTYE